VRRTSLAEAWRSDAFERFRGTAWMRGVIAEALTEYRDTAPLARRIPRLAEKLLRYP